jgi:hypothetical protein
MGHSLKNTKTFMKLCLKKETDVCDCLGKRDIMVLCEENSSGKIVSKEVVATFCPSCRVAMRKDDEYIRKIFSEYIDSIRGETIKQYERENDKRRKGHNS